MAPECSESRCDDDDFQVSFIHEKPSNHVGPYPIPWRKTTVLVRFPGTLVSSVFSFTVTRMQNVDEKSRTQSAGFARPFGQVPCGPNTGGRPTPYCGQQQIQSTQWRRRPRPTVGTHIAPAPALPIIANEADIRLERHYGVVARALRKPTQRAAIVRCVDAGMRVSSKRVVGGVGHKGVAVSPAGWVLLAANELVVASWQGVAAPLLAESVRGHPHVHTRPSCRQQERTVREHGGLGLGGQHVHGKRRRSAPAAAARGADGVEEGQGPMGRRSVATVLRRSSRF